MRILIVKLSSFGDLFHALPAVHCLKAGLNAEIDWVTQKEYVDLVTCFTDVDRVIPFPRRAFFAEREEFLAELRKREYDYVVDMQGLLKSAITTWLARGGKRIGPSFNREGSRFFYHAVAGKRDKNRHAVEESMDVVRYLGLPVLRPEFPVKFPERKSEGNRPRVAILPASRWKNKNWPVECFIAFGKRLQTTVNPSLFIIGGPGDAMVCEELEKGLGGGVKNLAGKLSFVETGGLLKEMDLLVSNDSGPVHMAAAVGTRTLVVFGPTDPKRTGPYGDRHRVVKTALPCQPCLSRTCRRGDVACLFGVTPERVGEMALEMLGERTSYILHPTSNSQVSGSTAV